MLYSIYQDFYSFKRITIYDVKNKDEKIAYFDVYYFDIDNNKCSIIIEKDVLKHKEFFTDEKMGVSDENMKYVIKLVFDPDSTIRINHS